jgi:hypothetical protein
MLRDFDNDDHLVSTEIDYSRYKTDHGIDVTLYTLRNNFSEPYTS